MKAKFLVSLVLFTCVFSQTAWCQEVSPKEIDLVFLIDSSGSASYLDPENFRSHLVKGLITLTQNAGVRRLAVYQFAGWKATQNSGEQARIVPLSQIPSSGSQRKFALDRLKKTIHEKLTFFDSSSATDFNYAFQELAGEVMGQRDGASDERILWIVLVSDGIFEVGEGKWTHPLYIEKAQEKFNKSSTRFLNQVARDYFFQQVFPPFDAPNVHFTVINPAWEAQKDAEVLQALVNRKEQKGQVFRVGRFPLKNLILPILCHLPWADSIPLVHWAEYSVFPKTSPSKRAFQVYPGAETVVVLFHSSGAFDSTILGPKGPISPDGLQCSVQGEGEQCRVYTMAGLPLGEYIVRTQVPDSVEGDLEILVFHDFKVNALVDFSKPGERVTPGKATYVNVRLTSETARLRDLFSLPGFQGYLELVEKEQKVVASQAIDLKDQQEGRYAVQVPKDAEPGQVAARLKVRAVPRRGGDFLLHLDAGSPTNVCISPVLHVTFEKNQIFGGEKVRLSGSSPSGTIPTNKPVQVRLLQAESGKEKLVSMRWNPAKKIFASNAEIEETGDWVITTPKKALVEILPGENGVLTVVRAPIPPWKFALGGLLLLLLVAIVFMWRWKNLTRWDSQRIVVCDINMVPVSEHFLREMSVGLANRKALGTPEAEGCVSFRLSGNGEKVKTQIRPKNKNVLLYVNEGQIKRWSSLAEEDLISIEAAGRSLYYRFYPDNRIDPFVQVASEGIELDDEVLILED